MDGAVTEIGMTAALNVVKELRLALGPVTTLLQNMVVMTVKEKIKKHDPVTRTHVQVRKSFVG